jgi:ribokinase
LILVAGSANLDFITRVSHLPRPGETVLGPGFSTAPGGKGANQAVACARAGFPTQFFGALGDDPYAGVLRDSLRSSGVQDLSLTLPLPTGAAFITVAESGENVIAVASGANAGLTSTQLPPLQGTDVLVLQLEIPLETVQAYARAARAQGVRVILNAAPAASLPVSLLADVDVLVVNEGELETLSGPGDLEEQLHRVQAQGPRTVLVTLGGKGSAALSGDLDGAALIRVPVPAVKVVDSTGAGDTYVGVLAGALGGGEPLEGAMRRATVAASLACTREGAQPSMPAREEIERGLQGGAA